MIYYINNYIYCHIILAFSIVFGGYILRKNNKLLVKFWVFNNLILGLFYRIIFRLIAGINI